MITHAELDVLLRRSGAKVDASECHGGLCGTLCAPEGDPDAWVADVLSGLDADATPVAATRDALSRLAESTRSQLRAGEFGFSLLLPKDGVHLVDRTTAMGEWCEGFLFGLGASGLRDFDRLAADAQEIVRDIVEIARIGPPAGENEDDEAAFVELVEYLRVGVQLLYERAHPGPAPAELQAPPGLH